jgi:hypothetical protein
MELDIIVFKDQMYHVYTIVKNVTDCFDYCDILREKYTTYLEDMNRHIITSGQLGGGQWFGCMCR